MSARRRSVSSAALTTTCRARLPDASHDEALLAFGAAFGSLKRHLMRPVAGMLAEPDAERRKDMRNALKTQTCAREGVSARWYNSALAAAEGASRSVLGLAKERVKTRERKLKARKAKLAKAKKAEEKLLRDIRAGKKVDPGRTARKKARQVIAGHEAAIAKLERQLIADRACAARPFGIFFGRKVMKDWTAARLDAEHTGKPYDEVAHRHAWRLVRDGDILVVGSSDESDGNQSCKLDWIDFDAGRLHLAIRPMTAGKIGDDAAWIEIRDIAVNDHMARVLAPVRDRMRARAAENDRRAAGGLKPLVGAGASLGFRFKARPPSGTKAAAGLSVFEVMITVGEEVPVAAPLPKVRGSEGPRIMGIDLNADHAAWAVIDGSGNVIARGRVALPLRQKSSAQREALIGEAVAQLVALAEMHGCRHVAIEDLDFIGKPATRWPGQNRTMAAMPARAFAEMLTRRGVRKGLAVLAVNPAGTSVLGRVNHAYPSGVSVHEGAAIAIARRLGGFSERIRLHKCFPRCRPGSADPDAPEDAFGSRPRDWRAASRLIGGFAAWSRKSRGRTAAPASAVEWRKTLLGMPFETTSGPSSQQAARVG